MAKKTEEKEEGTGWLMIQLDPKVARRQGMPAQLPVPKAEFEGMAEKGLSVDNARKWVKDFLTSSPAGQDGTWRRRNTSVVTALEAFIDNAKMWETAQKAFAESDFPKAISTLKRISIMNADDHAAKLNLACAYANTRDYKAALKAFKEIRESFEGEAEYHVNVGQVYVALRDTDNAINEFVLALEASPDCAPAMEALVQLGVLTPIYENPRDAASLTYVRADSVVQYLGELWDKEPHDAAFFLEQLAYHEREGRWHIALEAATRAVKAAGDAGSERGTLGRIAALRSLGRVDEALAEAEAYAQKAGSVGAETELSKTLAAAGRNDDANAAIDRALARDPGDLDALTVKFWPTDKNDIRGIGERQPALEAFVKAHEDVAGAIRMLARMYLPLGRLDEALDIFAKAVALAPADDDLRAEYWSELNRQQKYNDVLKDAAKITDMTSRDWKLRWSEADAYAGLGKRMEARTAFTAINLDDRLHVDIRKRAKRAVKSIDEAPPDAGEIGGGAPAT